MIGANKNIAVINLTRMGDLLMTGPLIDRLRQIYPGRSIHLYAVTGYMPIAEGMDVDRIVPVDFNMLATLSIRATTGNFNHSLLEFFQEFRKTLQPLFEYEYEAIFNVSFTDISSLLSFMLRGPVKSGLHLDFEGYRLVAGTWARFFFAGNLNRELNPFHLVDVLVGASGELSSRTGLSRMKYAVPESVRLAIREKETEFGLRRGNGPRIVIQCGASTEDKRWEAEYFGQTGRLLAEQLNANILLVGTEKEKHLAETAAKIIGANATVLAGKTNLPQLSGWLETADLLITNDTGTMHLAQSVGTPCLVITLGTALSDETGPYGENNLVIEPDINCFPCNFRVKCPHFNCHKQITPEAVSSFAKDMLEGKVQEGYTPSINTSGMTVWRTQFDRDGWWRKLPVSPVPADKHRITREVFRELCKTTFEPDLRPNGALAEHVAEMLLRMHGSPPADILDRILEQDLPAALELARLAVTGKELSSTLGNLSGDINGNIEQIKTLGRKLAELDDTIDSLAIVQELWRPVMMMFQFGRSNFPSEGLNLQAKAAFENYTNLEQWTRGAVELITDSIRLWKKLAQQPNQHAESISQYNKVKTPMLDNQNSTEQKAFSSIIRPRMKTEKLGIIILESGYFIQREISDAFKRLGHSVIELQFEDNPQFITQLLEASMRSDFLLTINHLGFDQHGELSSLLAKINLPHVSWFVDRPGFILLDYEAAPNEMSFIYSWERSTIGEIRSYGFERVDFLPLATDPTRFTPGPDRGIGDVRLIANSMLRASAEWRDKAGLNGTRDTLFERAVALQRSGRIEAKAAVETSAVAEGLDISSWSPRHLLNYASAVALTATRELRHDLVTECNKFDLHLYGDDEWLRAAPGVAFHGYVEYPDGLPDVYRGGIHLNATSFQMPTAVNQRVFDIPACGGILVTDDQEDLHDLFDVESECILYQEAEEAAMQIETVLRHRTLAEKIVVQAAKRIQKQHTYNHRAIQIIKALREEFGKVMVQAEGGLR